MHGEVIRMGDTPENIAKRIKSDFVVFLGDKNSSYQDFVIAGRNCLKLIECHQAIIAYYACRVCTITNGGYAFKEGYTITQFSKDIGINTYTLSEWVRVYRFVIERLGISLEEIDEKVWKKAIRVHNRLNEDVRRNNLRLGKKLKGDNYKSKFPVKDLRQIYKDEDDKPSVQSEMRQWMLYIKTMHNNLQKRNLALLHKGDLMEMIRLLDNASDYINDFLSRKK